MVALSLTFYMLFVQVLLDQLTFGPFCNALFMSYIAMVVEGETHSSRAASAERRMILEYGAWKCLPGYRS